MTLNYNILLVVETLPYALAIWTDPWERATPKIKFQELIEIKLHFVMNASYLITVYNNLLKISEFVVIHVGLA